MREYTKEISDAVSDSDSPIGKSRTARATYNPVNDTFVITYGNRSKTLSLNQPC